jgi:hypothetical protein
MTGMSHNEYRIKDFEVKEEIQYSNNWIPRLRGE